MKACFIKDAQSMCTKVLVSEHSVYLFIVTNVKKNYILTIDPIN